MDGGEVGFAFLELAHMDCEEVGGGELSGDVGHKEGGEGDIEWENGFDAMGHVERGVAGRFASRRTVCPKRVRGDGGPLCNVSFACLNNRLPNCAMLAFDDPVCTGVVG